LKICEAKNFLSIFKFQCNISRCMTVLDFNLSAGKFRFSQPLFQRLCYSLQSRLLSITALENRGKYKFPLTDWSFWRTLLDELIRNLSLDYWRQRCLHLMSYYDLASQYCEVWACESDAKWMRRVSSVTASRVIVSAEQHPIQGQVLTSIEVPLLWPNPILSPPSNQIDCNIGMFSDIIFSYRWQPTTDLIDQFASMAMWVGFGNAGNSEPERQRQTRGGIVSSEPAVLNENTVLTMWAMSVKWRWV